MNVTKTSFPENQPARTTVGAQLPKFKIEIDCIARQRAAQVRRSCLPASFPLRH
jgi:hypothetical protein